MSLQSYSRTLVLSSLVFGSLLQLASSAEPVSDVVKDELARLKGTWIAKKRFTESGEDETVANGAFKYQLGLRPDGIQWRLLFLNALGSVKNSESCVISIDPAREPKTLDIKTFPTGKLKYEAIYKLEGNELTVAMGPSRPTSFEATEKGSVVFVFKKRGR